MSIIRFENVSLAYGHRPLLDDVTFAIEEGQKICLLGRNGEGKSTLMSLLMKSAEPDSGVINFQKGLKVGSLPQQMPDADERNVFDVVAEGLPEIGKVLSEYHHLINIDNADLQKLEVLQEKIESLDGWDFDTRIASMLKAIWLTRIDANERFVWWLAKTSYARTCFDK